MRLVEFSRRPEDTSLQRGETIRLLFDRRLSEEDHSPKISFLPEIDFSAQTNGQSITITLDDNLQSSTKYSLNIAAGISEDGGSSLSSGFSYTFTSAAARLLYIDRNYPDGYFESPTNVEDDVPDNLMLTGLNGEPESIFSHAVISSYAATDAYAAVLIEDDGSNRIFIVNLDNRNVREVTLPFDGQVRDLSVARRGDRAYYRIRPDFREVSDEFFALNANRVEAIDLETSVSSPITNDNGDLLQAFSLQIDPTGTYALIQENSLQYFAISPFDDFEPVLIGSRSGLYGFSADGNSVLFRDNEALSSYDVASSSSEVIATETEGFIRSASGTDQGGIVYVANDSRDGLNQQEVRLYKDGTTELIVSSLDIAQDATIENARTSLDGRHVAIEVRPEGCRFDQVDAYSVCQGTYNVIYDIQQQRLSSQLDGFAPTWLP